MRGAARRCSQKAMSVRCVVRLRSDISNFIAVANMTSPIGMNTNEGYSNTKPLLNVSIAATATEARPAANAAMVMGTRNLNQCSTEAATAAKP